MAASERRNSNTQLLEELEELSQSLYQAHTSATRRTASLVLPRTAVPAIIDPEISTAKTYEKSSSSRPRSRRMSLSPWRSRPKPDDSSLQKGPVTSQQNVNMFEDTDSSASTEKKGIWSWKPIRAISHIGMQKLSCLFSVEVVAVQGLAATMNGLRLSVCIRKKESKDGAVHTMPSRVSQGIADFEETLFIKCHVYYSHGSGKQNLKFEPRPFLVYVFALDAEELDFGRSSVDLSRLIQESMEKSVEGARVRQWDTSFSLSGKAKGGELVLKLGFQIMEKEGGIDIYSPGEGGKSRSKMKNLSTSFGRKQSKTSFSVPSPRLPSRPEAWTPSQAKSAGDFQGIDELNLDDEDDGESATGPVPDLPPPVKKPEDKEQKVEDLDLPDFDVVDKGVEIQDEEGGSGEESEDTSVEKSASSEVIKNVVDDPLHKTRLTELDSIAQQIKALESMMGDDKNMKSDDETGSQRLDADEETVTKEFLQMLEHEEASRFKFNQPDVPPFQLEGGDDSEEAESDSEVYLSDLGKGLGCVVQTRHGGYLAAMNPLDTVVLRRDEPKLAMQMSKPVVVLLDKSISGVELFQKMASLGFEELSSQIESLMPLDELVGKTAEQIAFEGIASAIIQGRNKEGASSSAARIISAVKSMANAMSTGRKDRITTGIWNVNESPLTAEEILAFSMQKVEAMAVEALKIQAEISEEEAPFDVSALNDKKTPLSSAIPLEDWIKNHSMDTSGQTESLTIAVIVQLRDPVRRYEAVGGPMLACINATQDEIEEKYEEEEKKFKVTSLHVGGFRAKAEKKRSIWDTEKQRLTAMQWLVAYGIAKGGKKGKNVMSKGKEVLWSISSRIMAAMWLKSMRNPDVKFTKKVEQVAEEVASLKESLDRYFQRNQRCMKESQERAELLGRANGESSHVLRIFDEEAQAMQSVHNSKRMLAESLSTGSAILSKYSEQRERLKVSVISLYGRFYYC